MNGVHDMGGMHCFGSIDPDPDEPLFHDDWERRVLALTLAMGATGQWNLDESRAMRESLPADFYLSAGYYRIWLAALEQLLLEKRLVTADELAQGRADGTSKAVNVLTAERAPSVLAAGSPVNRATDSEPEFSIGQQVVVRNYQPSSHTRLPGYLRGRTGVIMRIHGCHVFPDTHAVDRAESPSWLYNVSFNAAELWQDSVDKGNDPQRSKFSDVRVDCWEPYLKSLGSNTDNDN